MKQSLNPLEQTFLDLVAIDEVHPHEHEVLEYIKLRLREAHVQYKEDAAKNIVATIPGKAGESVALVGHVDIAVPLGGRQVVVEPDIIKTDGTGILGADDKTAVAIMLELADSAHRGDVKPARPIELIFTVGEEAGCVGAVALYMPLVHSRHALVLDWTGPVNSIVTKSPAYFKIDVEYIGHTAHPSEWEDGRNAGAALIEAASKIKQGEYAPGVTCNIGIFGFGEARNQVPGRATLQAELRSYDTAKVEAAAAEIRIIFERTAADHSVEPRLAFVNDSPAYELNQSGELFARVARALATQSLEPELVPTYGCFDGNVLAARGIEVIMLGAGYYQPHSPGEYLKRSEFSECYDFILQFVK